MVMGKQGRCKPLPNDNSNYALYCRVNEEKVRARFFPGADG